MTKIAALLACLFATSVSPAAAETDAQWAPNKQNKISTCRTLWIGLSDVPGDINAATRDTTFVCHKRYVLSHDNVNKTPDWVIERLTKAQVSGKNNRPKKGFSPEPRVPPRGRATNADYTKPKNDLARGHMAPSEDFNKSLALMKESFMFSNAVPQIGAHFNGTVWAALEDEVRKAAKARNDIHVITGPVRGSASVRSATIPAGANACGKEIKLQGPDKEAFICAASNKKPNEFCAKGVAVPIGIYKIVFDAKAGTSYAFLLPNMDHPNKKDSEVRGYLEGFRVSIAVIENQTGLRFMQDLPAEAHTRLVQQCTPGALWD